MVGIFNESVVYVSASGLEQTEQTCWGALFYIIDPRIQIPYYFLVTPTFGFCVMCGIVLLTFKQYSDVVTRNKKKDALLLPAYVFWLLGYAVMFVAMIIISVLVLGMLWGRYIVEFMALFAFITSFLLPLLWVFQPDMSKRSKQRVWLMLIALIILYFPVVAFALPTAVYESTSRIPIGYYVYISPKWTVYYSMILSGIEMSMMIFLTCKGAWKGLSDLLDRLFPIMKIFNPRISVVEFTAFALVTDCIGLLAFLQVQGIFCLMLVNSLVAALWPVLTYFILRRDSIYLRRIGASDSNSEFALFFKELTEERWIVNYSDVILDKVVGRGGAGVVHLATWKGIKVAVKMLNSVAFDDSNISEFTAEVAMLKRLRHPHVVQLIGAIIEAPHFALVTEFLDKGSLMDVLSDTELDISWPMKFKFMKEAALGLFYLHTFNPPIIHRDIKSTNYLVDNNYTVKVGDLGAAQLKDNNSTLTFMGTPRWAAPEVMLHAGFTEQSDVYAYGIVMWEILTREMPYGEIQFSAQVILKVTNDQCRPRIPKDCHPLLSALIQTCWAQSPDERPSMQYVLGELDRLGEETLQKSTKPEKQIEPNETELLLSSVV